VVGQCTDGQGGGGCDADSRVLGADEADAVVCVPSAVVVED